MMMPSVLSSYTPIPHLKVGNRNRQKSFSPKFKYKKNRILFNRLMADALLLPSSQEDMRRLRQVCLELALAGNIDFMRLMFDLYKEDYQ